MARQPLYWRPRLTSPISRSRGNQIRDKPKPSREGAPGGLNKASDFPSPSKIPYVGLSPVRLQMDRQWRPSTTSQGLSAVHIRPVTPSYTPPQLQVPGSWESRGSPIYSVGLCPRAASLTPVARRVQVTVASSSVVAFTPLLRVRRPHWSFRGLLNVHWLLRPVGSLHRPRRHICLEGFDGFVSSTIAPIATGWSDPDAGWDLHPLKT
jgi:hypothetical protein